jgi:hypothetical protein
MPCFCGDSAAAGIFCIKKGVPAVNSPAANTSGTEVIWGAKAIAVAIGRTEKATFAVLESGKLVGAKKIKGKWAFSPAVFHASFEAAA